MFFQDFLIVFDLFELALTVGASTFALTFYFMGIKDGTIDASEKRFMHAVYFALRLALALIIVTEVYYLYQYGLANFPLAPTLEILLFRWAVIAIIIVNAVLMHIHKMPMWLGPALAGGSWYTLFAVSVWPNLTAGFIELSIYYAVFVIFMVGLLRVIKSLYLKK
ncbi:MAG: hypothetical protein WDZ90_03175 [Candidatus Paceibacterota bacterium]